MGKDVDGISGMKTMPKRSGRESSNPIREWSDQTELKTALKKFSQECSKAGISTQPLSKLLSTIYGRLGVVKGYAAMLNGKLSLTPVVLNRKTMMEQSQLTLDEVWNLESIVSLLQEDLEERKEPSGS